MKKLLMIALLCVSTAAIAEDGKTNPGNNGGKKPEMSFEQRKANILQRLQKKEACVQAATSRETLQSCFPRWKERHEGKGGDEGMEHSDK
jgi:hypothetical protein